MKKEKLKVAVIYNEPAPELYKKLSPGKARDVEYQLYYEFDKLTPMEEYEIIAKKLRKVGFNTYTLNIKDNLKLLLDNLEKNSPDVIFNFVELFKDQPHYEMNIVGIYELLGIPYTGAPALALANCQNKILSKRLLELNGVKVPPYFIVEKKATDYPHDLKYPLLVKPSLEDASVGIENDSIVTDGNELKERVDYVIHYFTQPVLVEEFIEGRELNVSVIGDKKPKALPISEIDFSEMPDHLHNIVSYQAKWDPQHESYHKTIPKCPASLSDEIELKVKETAIKSFIIMGCRDYARVDMRLTKNNKLYVLEVNPNPDITDGAGFMRSAVTSGLAYTQTLKKIVLLAAARGKT